MGYSVDPITGAMVGHPHTIGGLSNVEDAADFPTDGQVLTWDSSGFSALATDTFTRANSAVLGNTETGGYTWVDELGNFEIIGNQAEATDPGPLGNDSTITFGALQLDQYVQGQLTSTDTFLSARYLVTRGTGAGWTAIYAGRSGVDAQLYLMENGNIHLVSTFNYGGGSCLMRLEVIGDSIEVFVNGISRITWTNTYPELRTGLKVGIRGSNSSAVDNFEAGLASGQWHAETAASSGAQGPMGPWIMGPEGDDGPMGMPIPGTPGSQGTAGSTGPTGGPGPPGFGMDGEDGDPGMPIPGPVGATGAPGTPGSAGAQGPIGPWIMGQDGDDGRDGNPGAPGVAGANGAPGTPGAAGAQGLMGPPGSDGDPDEPILMPGPAGAAGATGPSGGAGTQTAFTKDLGVAQRSGTFAVTGLSGLTSGNSYDVRQSAAAITTKGSARDESEMDTIIVTAYADSTTTLKAFWFSANGSVQVGDYAFVSIT